ncbi:MAG: hypothetical protein A2014_04030 [Spirochaetes bacterium GWF1_49_6]|jgi:hypothetical protein|nr:MAG: hypothetical protein A2014_04030 [Spirochaetes bacterium GWF1_49_6]
MEIPEIQQRIAQGEDICFDLYVMDGEAQQIVHSLVQGIINKYERQDLEEMIYSSLKELIINGVKANLKHFLFKAKNINDTDEEHGIGFDDLKRLLDENELERFKEVAAMEGLSVRVTVIHSQERLMFLIENNTPMTRYERRRVREKFDSALQYDNIFEYYLGNADDTEGSGLGITMIVLMLKGVGIDPHAFSINVHGKNTTVAKIHLPLR